MYELISIGRDEVRRVELCAYLRKPLNDYLFDNGYFWSKTKNRFVKKGGFSWFDYVVEKIENK